MIKYKMLGMHCEDMRFRLNVVKAEPQTKFEIKPEFNRQLKKIKELPKRRILELTVKMRYGLRRMKRSSSLPRPERRSRICAAQ